MIKNITGVVVGRFQVPELHAGHKKLFDEVYNSCNRLIIIIGSAHPINTRRDPLDYKARELMLKSYYPEVTILSIKDMKSDDRWSQELDTLIEAVTIHSEKILLFGGRDSFINHYTGKFETRIVDADIFYSGTKVREELWNKYINSKEFRTGVIWAAYNKYPSVHPVVDVAIFSPDHKKILLGAKYEDFLLKRWRLVGGFVDINDDSYMSAAKREVYEELGGIGVDDYQYITDFKINDWRYKNQEEVKLHTTLFSAVYMFGSPTPGDDLYAASWFDFNENLLDILVDNHKKLVKILLERKN